MKIFAQIMLKFCLFKFYSKLNDSFGGNIMKLFTKLVFILAATSFIAGCNTVHGVGKDLEAGGEKIQSAAQKSNPKTGAVHKQTRTSTTTTYRTN